MQELVQLSAEQLAALRKRAQALIDAGHDEGALVLIEMLTELDRRDQRAALKAVDLLLGLGRSTEAAERVTVILKADPMSYDGLLARAKVALATGAWGLAAATLEDLIKRDPEAKTESGQRAHALARDAHRLFDASR
jgi:predicted Zn-dependent protease